jgi:hypothetical protein
MLEFSDSPRKPENPLRHHAWNRANLADQRFGSSPSESGTYSGASCRFRFSMAEFRF